MKRNKKSKIIEVDGMSFSADFDDPMQFFQTGISLLKTVADEWREGYIATVEKDMLMPMFIDYLEEMEQFEFKKTKRRK
jgi:hypothetical protein